MCIYFKASIWTLLKANQNNLKRMPFSADLAQLELGSACFWIKGDNSDDDSAKSLLCSKKWQSIAPGSPYIYLRESVPLL